MTPTAVPRTSPSWRTRSSRWDREPARNRFSFTAQKHEAPVLERENNDVDREKVCDEIEVEESVAKPWNLRPRKAVSKVTIEIGGVPKNGELQETSPAAATIPGVLQTENLPKSLRLRGFAEGQGSEKKEKRKFWISLSREEIEEDVYAMTGSKPARRPKKRPKNVQKQLDVRDEYLVACMIFCFDSFDCWFAV
ncbi:hypothetical protein F0562_012869 [Nyssa sinensis]|uniref:Uncharacterized protein n=1 Tax=Nyssa sinensis TaxID=561372 RepID=A0A5J4ZWP7_9ASTE|nr:hypothetical protein F0562_012869 [Nyssa sinensis]